jgi:phosphoserine aminotransferase
MRAYNFSPGPAMLPEEVIQQIKDEIFNWKNSKISILEVSHRSKEVINMLDNIKTKLSKLLNIPTNYKILFSHGGAQGQFSAIPMNLAINSNITNYLVTGIWSEKAAKLATQYSNVNIINEYLTNAIKEPNTWNINNNADYIYYCPNETVNGIAFNQIPNIPNHIPLIADMTSSILTEEIDINKFALIYASAQKTMGIAGVTLIIIREDLLTRKAISHTPNILNYKIINDMDSLVNTMPVFALYVMDLMLDWTIKQGGLSYFSKIHEQQANLLYSYIDNNDFFINTVENKFRSKINIPFSLKDNNLNKTFLDEATNNNLLNLKGHALVGGIRASFYNSMPLDAAIKLIDFCKYFVNKYA